MHVENGVIMLVPVRSVREGWKGPSKKWRLLVPDALENDFDAEGMENDMPL